MKNFSVLQFPITSLRLVLFLLLNITEAENYVLPSLRNTTDGDHSRLSWILTQCLAKCSQPVVIELERESSLTNGENENSKRNKHTICHKVKTQVSV